MIVNAVLSILGKSMFSVIISVPILPHVAIVVTSPIPWRVTNIPTSFFGRGQLDYLRGWKAVSAWLCLRAYKCPMYAITENRSTSSMYPSSRSRQASGRMTISSASRS